MKKIIFSLFVLIGTLNVMAIDVIGTGTTWIPAAGTAWSVNATTNELSYDGAEPVGPPAFIATTFGCLTSSGAYLPNWNYYAGLTLTFDAYISSNAGDTTSVVLSAKDLLWTSKKGVLVQVNKNVVQVVPNTWVFANAVKLSTSDAAYQGVVIPDAYNSFVIQVSSIGTVSVTINGYKCPTDYVGGTAAMTPLTTYSPASRPALFCTSFAGFKLKNVVAVLGTASVIAGTTPITTTSTVTVPGGRSSYFAAPTALNNDWWPQWAGSNWVTYTNGDLELNTFPVVGTIATQFGVGGPYTNTTLKFDAIYTTDALTNFNIVFGSDGTWGNDIGIIVSINQYVAVCVKGNNWGGQTLLYSNATIPAYQAAFKMGSWNHYEISIGATGIITTSINGVSSDIPYQADVTFMSANPHVLVESNFASANFRLKNLVFTKATTKKSYFPNNGFLIAASPNDGNKGGVVGSGTYDLTSDVTLVATATSGNKFVNWTENGTEVSTAASYTFSATAARTLVANFAVDLGTSISDKSENKLNVYPSNQKGLYTISTEAVGTQYTVVNAIGQQINKGIIKSAQQQLDLTAQQKGTYMVIVNGNSGKLVKKIVRN